MKIDASGWKVFHLYDIFDISMGNKFDKSKMAETPYGVNFVGRSSLNNGIACQVALVKDKTGNVIKPYPAGDITIAMGGSIGSCYVQPKEFYTSQNVCVLHSDDINITLSAKQFIATAIFASCKNYEAFVDELNRHIKTDFCIQLPVTSNGTPDWQYMDNYIKCIERTARSNLATLKEKNASPRKRIDTSEWKDFRIGDLFEKLELKFIPNRPFNKAFDVSQIRTREFNLPLVNAKHDNNGIMYYGRKEEWEFTKMSIDIVQNGAISTGDVYAQPQDTGVLWDAYLIKPKFPNVTENILLYLATTIQTSIKKHFSYDNKCIWDKAQNEVVKLPVKYNQNGIPEPDWNYMEQYIEQIKTKAKNTLLLQHAVS